MIRLLFLGEIIGMPSVKRLKEKFRNVVEKYKVDFSIINGDGASDGYGLLKKTACDIHRSGIDVVTGGDFIFNKKDVRDLLREPFMLRPYNLPGSMGGKGYSLYQLDEINIGIINILGRTNFNKVSPLDPFYAVDKVLEKISDQAKIIIVDFHGGTTGEIQAMHWHLAGKVSLVAGSHLRVLTSDYRIVNQKTAIVTGLGFCGATLSIGGLNPEIEIQKIKYGQFMYSKVASEAISLQGVIVEIDEDSGKALSINLFKENL